MMAQTGMVRRWGKRGYGFIRADDGADFFAHVSQVVPRQKHLMREGLRVEFAVGKDREGKPRAVVVRAI